MSRLRDAPQFEIQVGDYTSLWFCSQSMEMLSCGCVLQPQLCLEVLPVIPAMAVL